MGADYEGQEKGIAILRALPVEAREYIAHHLRNALAGAIGSVTLAKMKTDDEGVFEWLKKADECLDHAVEDLKTIGC